MSDPHSASKPLDDEVRTALERALEPDEIVAVEKVFITEELQTLSALEMLSDAEFRELRTATGLSLGQMTRMKRALAEARLMARLKAGQNPRDIEPTGESVAPPSNPFGARFICARLPAPAQTCTIPRAKDNKSWATGLLTRARELFAEGEAAKPPKGPLAQGDVAPAQATPTDVASAEASASRQPADEGLLAAGGTAQDGAADQKAEGAPSAEQTAAGATFPEVANATRAEADAQAAVAAANDSTGADDEREDARRPKGLGALNPFAKGGGEPKKAGPGLSSAAAALPEPLSPAALQRLKDGLYEDSVDDAEIETAAPTASEQTQHSTMWDEIYVDL